MKSIVIIGFFLLIVESLFCQIDGFGNWLVNIDFGIEAHDKRLFDYSEKESLLAMQPEFWGTYHIGLQINKRVIKQKKLSVLLGLGFSYERSTFIRPFDHFSFEKDSFLILRNLDRYEKVQLPISMSTLILITNNFFISGEIESNFLLHRSINHTENNSGVFPYTDSKVRLEDLNLKIAVVYRVNNLMFGLKARVLNFQKIDKIIFNSYIKDPRVDRIWEWNNPLRFDFTVGYLW